MGCACNKGKQAMDYLITYSDGSTERVAGKLGLIAVRQKILKGGGGTWKAVKPA
ncbi:hypothetical protein [Streptomyces sp. NPDC048338]|uniref:hypothetical protein n=1 Tax=Streptomyces sp. NPDC048338 TaxID=3365536 RepID=UPI0037202D60